jgi:hypothetical protein
MPMNHNYYILFMNGLWETSPIQNLIGPFTLPVTSHLPSPVPSIPLLQQQPPSLKNPTSPHFVSRLKCYPLHLTQLPKCIPSSPIIESFPFNEACWLPYIISFLTLVVSFPLTSKLMLLCFQKHFFPPVPRSEAWGVSVFPVFPQFPCVSPVSRNPYSIA